jgi:hypothetical protein
MAETVTCPRCQTVAPLEQQTALERNPAAARIGWVAEAIGLLIMLAGYPGLGVLIMMVGAGLVLANLRTPTGTCRNCGAKLTADWRGHWYSKERA